MKCEFGCNGSGTISTKDGKFILCECLKVKKAKLVFERSNAPKGSFSFVKELKLNPFIQSMNMVSKLKEELENVQSKEEMLELKKKSYKPLKEVLLQYTEYTKWKDKNYRLYLSGDTGTGKSYSAIALGCEGGSRGAEFYYLSFHKIQKLFRYNFKNEEETKLVEKMKQGIEESDILILDDLGAELNGLNLYTTNDGEESSDLMLVKKIYRYLSGVLRDSNKLVIITSNMKQADAKNLYASYDRQFTSILFDNKVMEYQFGVNVRSKQETDDELF